MNGRKRQPKASSQESIENKIADLQQEQVRLLKQKADHFLKEYWDLCAKHQMQMTLGAFTYIGGDLRFNLVPSPYQAKTDEKQS